MPPQSLTLEEMQNTVAKAKTALEVRDTDLALARGIRRLATKADLDAIDLDTLRTLALSCAYRIEKLNGGAP